jgi:O-antigen/teichoic acid export membrane protein
MKSFVKDTLLLFLALRAGDLISVAAGMWFVPKYVSSNEIGAVLPITSFATFLSLPVFALAMVVMKESACLAVKNERGKIKTLLSSVFKVTAIIAIVVLILTFLLMPQFCKLVQIDNSLIGFLVVASSFLGCVAPVWTDALQSLKKFKALALIEVFGSLGRFAVMFFVMPLKALCGYFLAQTSLPAFRMIAGILALKKDLQVKAEPFWNQETVKRMSLAFIAVLAYQSIPMLTSMIEHTLLRTSLPSIDSAGFYMVSRFSDFLYYTTFPMLLVMFPYTASAAEKRESTSPYVIKCSLATLIIALLMSAIYFFLGDKLLSLMPNGNKYLEYANYMPYLTIITALTSCQVFFTNAEVSAGRFKFLYWLIPLHVIYIALFYISVKMGLTTTLQLMIWWFTVISLLRFAFSLASLKAHNAAV